jgi:alkylation response protein AidB-like acyl-CoA dehydrogenase
MRRTIFDSEHEQFRESVRGFLERHAAPNAERWRTRGIIDREFWLAAAEHGFVGFQAPEEFGGAGIEDFRFNAILDEEVAYSGTPSDQFSLINVIVTPYLIMLTTPAQRQRWLPGITSGRSVVSIGMSEPGAGSDLRGIATRATWNRDHWVLTGSKTFVTSGFQADYVLTLARIEREDIQGQGLFMVATKAEGVARGRKLEKIGRRGQDTAEIFFQDVVVKDDDIVGEPGRALNILMANLPYERLSIAVTAVAAAERALEVTLDYVRGRNAFGRPIGSFQANRFALAEAATKVAVARVYVDRCVQDVVAGTLTADEAAGAKFWTTELQFEVTDLCLQMHGGYGYMEEYEIARLWRDSRVTRIFGGTNEIMKELVGRSLGL